MRLLAALLLSLGLLVGCGADGDGADEAGSSSGAGSGERIEIEGDEALTWGEPDAAYGVVLAHGAAFDAASWGDQASAIAALGTGVVAVEDTSPESLAAAVAHLEDAGAERVALVGGSAGADAILDLLSEQPDLADLLVTLSANSTVEGLGDQPKLLVASEDEPGAADVARQLAESAPGDNETLIVPGSAHAQNVFDTDQGQTVLDAVLAAVQERLDAA